MFMVFSEKFRIVSFSVKLALRWRHLIPTILFSVKGSSYYKVKHFFYRFYADITVAPKDCIAPISYWLRLFSNQIYL